MYIDKNFNDTGISRRMDDLGRIVIPKDIRRKIGITLKDEEAGNVQWELFFNEDGDVLLKRV